VSPPVGADHVSDTELPDDEATRLIGADGAIAADPVTRRPAEDEAVKHPDVPGVATQAASDGCSVAGTITPKPLGVIDGLLGAVGGVERLQATRIAEAVTTLAQARNRCTLLPPGRIMPIEEGRRDAKVAVSMEAVAKVTARPDEPPSPPTRMRRPGLIALR